MHQDHCNCCGKKREDKHKPLPPSYHGDDENKYYDLFLDVSMSDDEEKERDRHREKEEDKSLGISIDIKGSVNNCSICNYWYCDKCRCNCFYEVEANDYRPATPVYTALVTLNQQQKSTLVNYQNVLEVASFWPFWLIVGYLFIFLHQKIKII